MNTRTIEISEKNFDIVAEVCRDGSIAEARIIVAHCEDTHVDFTEAARNSNYYSKLIAAEAEALDWNDHGDEGLESFRETVAKIIGVKAI